MVASLGPAPKWDNRSQLTLADEREASGRLTPPRTTSPRGPKKEPPVPAGRKENRGSKLTLADEREALARLRAPRPTSPGGQKKEPPLPAARSDNREASNR